jgi:hypothetical protein
MPRISSTALTSGMGRCWSAGQLLNRSSRGTGASRSDSRLCTTMWITCAKRPRACARIGKCWGLCCRGRACNRALAWENVVHILWIGKKAELSTRHAAIAHK